MSDRQKGLIKAVSKHFPTASKRYCARHIYANFRGSYCGDNFKKLFWKASRSSNVYDFKAALNDIGQIQPSAKECEAEVVQLWIWQISGIPCPHAMAAISHNCGKEALRDMVPKYVHQSLTKSAYMQTYRGMIHPVPNQKIWLEIEANEVLPPPIQVQPGRPKMQRKRESSEKSKGGRTGTVVCTYCKKAGHNTRICNEKKRAKKGRNFHFNFLYLNILFLNLRRTPEASSSQPTSTIQSQVHSQHPPSTAEASSSQTTKKKTTKKQHPTPGGGSHNPSQSQPQSQLTH
ncbi:hypothetical protein Q3G72_024729 [Acer saccharum]|nr:hypothetical protein Q3G72_024729 [Acer saccharum]